MALLRVVARGEEAHARNAERRAELGVDLRQVGGRARDGDVLGRDVAVLEANVARGVRHIVAADADLTILLDDGVEGGGDQRDRVHNREAGDVDLGPLIDGLVRLVDPDVDLLLEVLGPVELLEELLEEADTLGVRAADHHADLILLDAVRQITHAEVVLLGAGEPREDLSLDAVVRGTALGLDTSSLVEVCGVASGCLLNKALVVRAEDDVHKALAFVEEISEQLIVLDELLVRLRLAALRGAANSLNTAVERAHF